MSISVLRDDYIRYLQQVDITKLSNSNKFAFSYLQSISISINEFANSRNRQSVIGEKVTAQIASSDEIREQFYLEANCYSYLENIYIQIHRIEYMFRKDLLTLNFSNSMNEMEFQNWLNDFHFITMIRNKLFEHASENFDFFSDNGSILNLSDIYDYRVWFFQGTGAYLDTTLPIAENFNTCINKINETLDVDYEKPFFEKCKYIRRGALFLTKQEQYDLFENSLIKTGFVTHSPMELLCKAYNIAKLIFHNPHRVELNKRNVQIKDEGNIVETVWIY